jgi:hypothetical protein
LTATGRTSPHVAEIVTAAREGRVETLFVARDAAAAWGVHDIDTGTVEVHEKLLPGDEDLLELAVAETLAHQGTVYSVPAEEMPSSGPAAAILRYEHRGP